MSKTLKDLRISADFEIKDYVEAVDNAAQRTRWIVIVMVVATVIIGIGFYNSFSTSWATHRLNSVYDNEHIPRINAAADEENYPLLDSFFGARDFREFHDYRGFKDLACKIASENNVPPNEIEPIKAPSVLLSKYLFARFNEKSRKMLDEECSAPERGKSASRVFVQSLTIDLNIILKDKFLYKKERFQGVALREEITDLLELSRQTDNQGNKSGYTPFNLKLKDLIRLNRLLLESVYPQILESRDLLTVDGDDDGNVVTPGERQRMHRQTETTRSDVDNIENIRIHFFGIAVDVNDLGAIGGFALFIILLLLRFSLSREIKNLNVGFKEAFCHNKLALFYHLLAMRQVFTVPKMKGESRNKGLAINSKLVCLFPLLIILIGVIYDYYSTFWLLFFEPKVVFIPLFFESLWLLVILYFSLRCLERQLHIDKIWKDYWTLVKTKKPAGSLLRKDFDGIDEKIDRANLRRIIKNRLTDESPKDPVWVLELWKEFLKLINWLESLIKRFLKHIYREPQFF